MGAGARSAAGRGGPAVKSPLIVLGLALSALFNVFFIAGYVPARRAAADAGRAGDMTERVRGELGLDASQSALFDDLRQKWREDAEVYGDNLALLRQEMVEELDREPRDAARLGEVLDREAELRRQWRFAEANRFGDFLGALTPEQRRKLMGRLQHGGPPHGEMLRRFDANHNGLLEPQERAAAREFMRSHWAERARHWPPPSGEPGGDGRPEGFEHRGPGPGRLRGEVMRRFDADRDGVLGPQEESALLEWIRQGPSDEVP